MKHISNLINIIILFTPCILMSVAAAKKSVVLGVISIIFVFLFVFLAPIAKKKENFWMFVISTITLLPANIKIAVLAYSYISESKILSVSVAILLFFLLAGTEQILLGFITRAIKAKLKLKNIFKKYWAESNCLRPVNFAFCLQASAIFSAYRSTFALLFCTAPLGYRFCYAAVDINSCVLHILCLSILKAKPFKFSRLIDTIFAFVLQYRLGKANRLPLKNRRKNRGS